MRVYIAGPMSGYPDHNFPAFDDMAKRLREEGHMVFNPAENCGKRTDLSREQYMRHDLPMVLQAEGLVLLPEWWKSQGARLEARMALALGLDFYNEYGLKLSSDVVRTALQEDISNPTEVTT